MADDYDVPEREVCMCFHVPLNKLVNYYHREKPSVASLMSECLGAGSGCGWCVPFLEKMYEDLENGIEPKIKMTAAEYKERRAEYHKKLKGKSVADLFEEGF